MRSVSTELSSPIPSRKLSRASIDLSVNSKTRNTLLRSIDDFDIFDFFTKLKLTKLSIPETLIELSPSEVYFLSSPSNSIKTQVKNPGAKFFDFPKNPKNSPKYIHFCNNDIQVFYNEKDAIRCWNSYRGTKHRLQRYIIPNKNIPQKLRVHWRANKPIKSYLITNSTHFHSLEPKRFSIFQKRSSGHLHNLSEFPYAGQIYASSFNSFMPLKAVIPDKKVKNFLVPDKNSCNSKFYYTKLSNPEVELEEVSCCEEVKDMVEEFVKIFKEKWENKDHKTLSEALVDFLNDGKKWYLVKIKYFKVDYLPSKVVKNPLLSPQLLKKSVIDSELLEKIFNGIGESKKFKGSQLTQTNLLQRLSKIESKGKIIKNSGLKNYDLNDIVQKSVENYSRFSPTLPFIPTSLTKSQIGSINDAVKKYDEFRKSLK